MTVDTTIASRQYLNQLLHSPPNDLTPTTACNCHLKSPPGVSLPSHTQLYSFTGVVFIFYFAHSTSWAKLIDNSFSGESIPLMLSTSTYGCLNHIFPGFIFESSVSIPILLSLETDSTCLRVGS